MPRSIAFGNKKKKEQLQAKRKLKSENTARANVAPSETNTYNLEVKPSFGRNVFQMATTAIHDQPKAQTGRDTNRYALKFKSESKEELAARKQESYNSLVPRSEEELEKGCDDFFPEGIAFPKRPNWNPKDDEATFDAKENRYFLEYCKTAIEDSSYFDLNLETWRQLWRVSEKSDVLMVIVDVRFASLHFPPSLYNHIVKDLKKRMILVMNKIDLVSSAVVAAWLDYFKTKFPELSVICFTSLPSYNLRNPTASRIKGAKKRGTMKMAAEGALRLCEECEKLVGGKVDLSSWRRRIENQLRIVHSVEDAETEAEEEAVVTLESGESRQVSELFEGGILRIGAIGHPNVGKSSVLNALIGRKVVSVSRTPGHTKHFQTVHLTDKVQLLDCPGLVFPSKAPKSLQVLAGCFPISQLREPYSAVRLIAEHINLPSKLHLLHQSNEEEWSAFDICEAWAVKRGYHTARGGKPDVSRAANSLLRSHVDGALGFYLRPPYFTSKRGAWENHPSLPAIETIQALKDRKELIPEESEESSDEDSDSEPEDSVAKSTTSAYNKFAALEEEE